MRAHDWIYMGEDEYYGHTWRCLACEVDSSRPYDDDVRETCES